MKGSGGAVGLTENPTAFMSWMLSGPEQARLQKEFEADKEAHIEDHSHHEEGMATQKTFKQHTVSLVNTIKSFGNPFLESGSELLVLDTHDVLPDSVVQTIRTVQNLGQEHYVTYRTSVLEKGTKSIHGSITKNAFRLFKHPAAKAKQADRSKELKSDVSLFSRLYIVAQNRESDLGVFFQHENHP